MLGLANSDLSEIFKPKTVGETVNTHVVMAVPEPKPDYAAMQRLIKGVEKLPSNPEKHD